MNSRNHNAGKSAASPQRDHERERGEKAIREEDRLQDLEDDNGADPETADPDEREPRSVLFTHDGIHEAAGEQAEFREQFDEDLYTDREDPPAQGNTADDDERP